MKNINEKEIINSYLSGLSSLKVSKIYGLSKSTVLKILRKNDISRRNTSVKIDDETKNKIIDEYNKKTAIDTIIKLTKVSEKNIYKILHEENIVRYKNKKINLDIENKVCLLFNNGKTNKEICEILSIVPSTVGKILDKHNIKHPRYAHNKVDEHIRKKIVDEYANGKNICELSEEYGYGTTTIARWVNQCGKMRNLSDAFTLSFLKKRKYFHGTTLPYFSKKSNTWFFADSLWEAVRMEQIENDNNVCEWKRCDERIPYKDKDGKNHYYIPDLKIIYNDGKIIVEEIKPLSMINSEINLLKFQSAKEYFKNKNIEFIIVTEKEIGENNIKNFNPEGLMQLTKNERERRRKDKRNAREKNKRKRKKENDSNNK